MGQMLAEQPALAGGPLDRAIRAHVAGDLHDAEAAYRIVLAQQPRNAVALNNLSTILAGRRDYEGAMALLLRAVDADSSYAEALNNLGLVCNERGASAQARHYFERALALEPANADRLNNYGNTCVDLQRFDEALSAYDRAIALRPDEARFWSNRGIAMRGLRRHADAVASFQRALEVDPGCVNALSNLGLLYREERQFARAIDLFEQALGLEPENGSLLANYATVHELMGNHERMRELAERAVAIDPSHAEAYTLLANYQLEAGDYEAAEELYELARSLDAGNRNANWNLAIIWLTRGDFRRGWKQFEWRKQLQSVLVDVPAVTTPAWDGSPLAGRSILVCTEQGIGDTIQFIRYAQDLKRAGASTVMVECVPAIAPLVATVSGVDLVIERGATVPAHDVHVSLMSLPYLSGTTIDSIPREVPYVRAESRPVEQLVTAPEGMLKVGIVWAGNPAHHRDLLRSTKLADLEPLFDAPSTRFFSLQKGEAAERELAQRGDDRIVNLAPALADFQDTAAAISRLDLVITVDTSVAHLAAALGKPTWILLPFVADYRWLLDRQDSPWYPTVRLFRQARARDWTAVITAVAAELHTVRAAEAAPTPVERFDDPAFFAEYEAFVNSSLGVRPLSAGPRTAASRIAIDWELRSDTGWGVYGTNLALELVRRDVTKPVFLAADERSLSAAVMRELGDALRDSAIIRLAWKGTNAAVRFDGIMLKALGNNLGGAPFWNHVRAARNIGVIFFEDTAFDAGALQQARAFDRIIAGCTWNAEVLRAHGLDNVTVAFQGVDPAVFHPAPRTGAHGDRFVVFSGGKLEYRKGQDVVIAAFRRFRERHPEALLVTAWHNAWPHLITDLDRAGHVRGLPVQGNDLRIVQWLAENGIPREAVVDIGCRPNADMGAIIREAHVALFPNRCEGGTNLVAMECMAAGVPTIVSDNTGHRDLVATGGCLALRDQRPVSPPANFFRATDGWGETSVDEAVEALELVYQNRQAANALSVSGAEAMTDWSWSKQIDRFLAHLQPFLTP